MCDRRPESQPARLCAEPAGRRDEGFTDG
jgi:hypothetical protein